MSGTIIARIIFLSVILPIQASVENDVFIKGGLLFEKASDSPVSLNPPKLTFTRYLNFTTIEKALNQTQAFTNSYKEFCKHLNKKVLSDTDFVKTNKYFVSGSTMPIHEAGTYCKNRNARLPEIREQMTYHELFELAKANKLNYFPAGIYTDPEKKRYVFSSDRKMIHLDTKIFSVIYQQKESEGMCHLSQTLCTDKMHLDDLVTYHLEFHRLRLVQVNKKNAHKIDRVVCENEQLSNFELLHSDLLLKMAAHTCLRDLSNIKGMTDVIVEEATRFTTTKSKRSIGNTDQIFDFGKYGEDMDVYNLTTLPPPSVICIYDYLVHLDSCTAILEFGEDLTNLSQMFAEKLLVTDSLIAVFILQNIFTHIGLIPPSRPFYGCNPDNEILFINTTNIGQNLTRFVEYSEVVLKECTKWPYNIDTVRSNEIMVENSHLFEPIYEQFVFHNFVPNVKFNFTSAHPSAHPNPDYETHFDPHTDPDSFNYHALPQKRPKRLAPFVPIVGGIAGGSALATVATGGPPFSWFGSILSKTTGLMHRDDLIVPLEVLGNNTQMIHD